jgi:hypothetical protein
VVATFADVKQFDDRLAKLQSREVSIAAREARLLAHEQLAARAAGCEAEWLAACEAELDRRDLHLAARESTLNRAHASPPGHGGVIPSSSLDFDRREAEWWTKQLGPAVGAAT